MRKHAPELASNDLLGVAGLSRTFEVPRFLVSSVSLLHTPDIFKEARIGFPTLGRLGFKFKAR
jgi:hypothetical protein